MQVAAREALRRATEESVDATVAAYQDGSACVELIAGLRGKDHALTLSLRRIREGMSNPAARGPQMPPTS